tara:strand:- start:237 stop:617 length:381 start_codon:yes stop_codon:yes gene_type:complete
MASMGVLSTMLVCFLIATKTNAASSGVDGATSELLEGIALLQKAGPSQQTEVHAALAKAHVGLSTKIFADGRAQDNRLSVGVYGCFEPRRCPYVSLKHLRPPVATTLGSRLVCTSYRTIYTPPSKL